MRAAEVDVPLFNGTYKNIDETTSSDQSFVLIDGYLDEAPSISSRPGLSSLATLTTNGPIDGMHYVDALEKIFVLSSGNLSSFDVATMTETQLGGVVSNTGLRPTWVYDGTNLYYANGGQIAYTDGTTAPAYIADTDAPTQVTHITMIDSYLIANSVGSDTFYFSYPGDASDWSALDFATAEAFPDVNNALHRFRGELYLFGRESLEIWEDDGQTPWARVNGGSFDTGCVAPYSVITTENEILWLSDQRKFSSFAGSQIDIISTQFDREIEGFSVVSDCTSDRYELFGKTFIVFQFPSEGRTIVFNLTDKNWSEWGFWNLGGGFHEAFLGSCQVKIPDDGRTIVGTRKNDGKIFHMSEDFFTDDGDVINMITRSGHIDYGTSNAKRNKRLSMRVKRGYVSDDSSPVATMRFRDNNVEWSSEIEIDLGQQGDYENILRFHRTGRYRTRQYEFKCSAAVGFTFSAAKEEIEILGR